MPRAIVLGVVGDSGSGKTTLTRGLVRVLGDEHVTHLSADDYHRHDRRQRQQLRISPLHPDANHLDILRQHVLQLRRGEPILKPVYDHRNGVLCPPLYVKPARFLVLEGLLNYHTETLRAAHDVRVYLAPPEDLRRAWKLKRDCTRRGYTTDEVLLELDRREQDARTFIRPQRAHADIVVTFRGRTGDPAHLDAEVLLRDGLYHPDLSLFEGGGPAGPRLSRSDLVTVLWVPGDIDPGLAAELEAAIWERMSFANHLCVQRLGELTVGTDLLRSDSLALVQVIVLYHLMAARASLTSGSAPHRSATMVPTGSDSALHS